MNELHQKFPQEIEQILSKYPPERKRSSIMPLLFLAQRHAGSLTPQAIADVAELAGVTPTEVVSIVGFYTLFHEEGGRYRIQVCTDMPCALRGADRFLEELSVYLGIKPGCTTSDGLFTLEEVKCLAACQHAPMFQLQGGGEIRYYEDQSIETAKSIIEDLRAAGKGGA